MADEFLREGMHDIEAERYHQDPCPEPSASKSILHTIVDQSPRHAWHAHPRLNLKAEEKRGNKFNIGTAAHAMLTGRGNRLALIECDEYRTKDAKAARDEAYARGATPVTRPQWERLHEMVEVARKELVRHTDAKRLLDRNGLPEQTLIWREGELWCRCRPDWINIGQRLILDYKTTESAHPDDWTRSIFWDMGYDMQAAWYTRGAQVVLKERRWDFVFIVQEVKPPYGLSVIAVPPSVMEHGAARVDLGLHKWQHCLRTKDWPGYPPFTHSVELPDWQRTKWEQRKYTEKMLAEMAQSPLGKPAAQLPKPAKKKPDPTELLGA